MEKRLADAVGGIFDVTEPVLWSAEFKPAQTLTEQSFPGFKIESWPVVMPAKLMFNPPGQYNCPFGITFITSPNYLTTYSGGILHIPEVCIRKNSNLKVNGQVRWSRYTYKLHGGNRGICVGTCMKILDDGSIHLQIKSLIR